MWQRVLNEQKAEVTQNVDAAAPVVWKGSWAAEMRACVRLHDGRAVTRVFPAAVSVCVCVRAALSKRMSPISCRELCWLAFLTTVTSSNTINYL